MDLFSWICFTFASLFMLYAACIDWKKFTVPYPSIIGIALAGLVFKYHCDISITEPLIIAFTSGLLIALSAGFLAYWRGRAMLGYGDIQLMIASLIWLDISQISAFFLIAGIAGVLLAFIHRGYFPFAPGIGLAWFMSFLL